MTNRFGGSCYKCGLRVEPGTGRTWRAGRRWLVACSGCRGKREEGAASVGAEDLADPGAAAMEVAQGIEEAPARRRVRRLTAAQDRTRAALARDDAEAKFAQNAEGARAAVRDGRQPVACCTCGTGLELYERERAAKQCIGCRRDLPGVGVPRTPEEIVAEADAAEDNGGGPYPERLRGRLEGIGVTAFAEAV